MASLLERGLLTELITCTTNLCDAHRNLPSTFAIDEYAQYLSKWDAEEKKGIELEIRLSKPIKLYEAFADHDMWTRIEPRLVKVRGQLLERLEKWTDVWLLNPTQFEQLVAELLDVRFVIRPPASIALDKPRGLWNLVDVVTEDNLIRAIVTWMSPMPFPFAETVALTDLQRAQLESLVRAGSTPQALVFRCRLILRAADRDHPTNLQIAAEFDCNRHTVAGWRNRYLSNGLAGLQDAPRSGRPRRFSPLGEARSDQFGEQHNRTARLSRHPLVAG